MSQLTNVPATRTTRQRLQRLRKATGISQYRIVGDALELYERIRMSPQQEGGASVHESQVANPSQPTTSKHAEADASDSDTRDDDVGASTAHSSDAA